MIPQNLAENLPRNLTTEKFSLKIFEVVDFYSQGRYFDRIMSDIQYRYISHTVQRTRLCSERETKNEGARAMGPWGLLVYDCPDPYSLFQSLTWQAWKLDLCFKKNQSEELIHSLLCYFLFPLLSVHGWIPCLSLWIFYPDAFA